MNEDQGNVIQETIFTDSNGSIHLIHEITLGDVLISVLLASILIFLVLSRLIRR
ncbi:hypothetical protein [Halalkalibacter hemicellulosilyticus]|uniref:Uncharacterized protein n=1 Tax=Halalkalibacter hemicellulosilyticusJCM 9152 TaxID=1236971 RepID=W4QL70_9BACI|nr:hypothetical protein [Halalkalibacter hemicellulosilyticus]GAE32865.1 hypothetical protein JCM9152_4454 [Halalkalibacter hemicellulosilyticusJCM 9152]